MDFNPSQVIASWGFLPPFWCHRHRSSREDSEWRKQSLHHAKCLISPFLWLCSDISFHHCTATFVRKRGFFIGWSVDCLFPYYCIILNFLIWNKFSHWYGSILTLVFTTAQCLTSVVPINQKGTVHFWAALHFYSIANYVASWLKWLQMISNDSKWSQMTPNDFT